MVILSSRCKVALVHPGSVGSVQVRAMFAGVEAWFSCWPFLLVLHSGGFESWAPLSYLWHMYVFGKWISIQNLRELLIKGIKYQIKNSLSLQRLKFESQTPSERLESIRFLFGTCV